ncbi:aldehyde dehydrogenase family protein [Cohnella sp. REN36]|uniref:aldehyde dehydrogenase family protein n=1 Tax=Cohnella sp. REN36 TaxID=2887347 RepID=UPI001D14EE2F|nr:aldehyde dehydrogenase family protein [Cohnella sp. REN36]MCC3371693.1 aldehyde dehydrogenase family protein [Cohnella sp. REN36]
MHRTSLWIGGKKVETESFETLRAPYGGAPIAEVASAGEAEADQAIAAAVDAKAVMRTMPAHARATILERLAAGLEKRREEAARLIALEAGKPLKAAYAEVDRTVQTYKFSAEEAKRIHGETIPLDAAPGGEGRLAYTLREPVGVVGAITPFNFPMNLVAHKVGPALASGNTVVLKPAPQTPLTALLVAELLAEAGLPAGALNVLTGDGKLLGEKITRDPRVDAISFTGSVGVGARIRAQAGLKRVTLELGSNSAVIVDRDADLDAVAARCAAGAFSYQGQVCISLQRIYVVSDVRDAFVRKLKEEVGRLRLGDPLDPETDVSAMISPRESERALAWIAEALDRGASLAAGGTLTNDGVLAPTILLDVPHDARISCEEAFAPVVLVNRVDTIEEAIARVNDSAFGLQAGIYTNRLDTALRAADALRAGGVLVNDIPTFRVDHMPYGGIKESGVGREGVQYAIEELTEPKLVIFNRNV